MENLRNIASNKVLMDSLRAYFQAHLEKKIIEKALLKKDIGGYAEASEIIKVALSELENSVKVKKTNNLDQSI